MPIFCPSKPMLMLATWEISQTLNFNRNINARGQVQFLQLIHRLRGRLDNVEQPFVRADFKLFHRFLVDMRRTINREFFYQCRQRNWARHARAGALCRLDDLDRGLIEHAMIECFQTNPNFLAVRHYFFSFWSRMAATRFAGTGSKCDGSIE